MSIAAIYLYLVMLMPVAQQVDLPKNIDGDKYDKGVVVTIQGCVIAGKVSGTYVLNNLREWPVPNSPMGKYGTRHYWLENSAAPLGLHVGQTIQLKGTITAVEESEMELRHGEHYDGTTVRIERPGEDVTTTPRGAGLETIDAQYADIKITLLKLKLKEFLVVLPICLPQM